MKRYRNYMAVAVIGLSITGCMTPQGKPDNTASGALGGAAVGAIIGSTARNPGAGAAVGAAVGALAGGAVGHGIDQAQDAQEAQLKAQAQQQVQNTQPLTIDDVISMSKAKIGDELIISQIRNSRTVYHLKTADIVALKRTGVSERVIDFMINSPAEIGSAETASIARTPPPPPLVEPVIVAPGPGYFWMGGEWIWFNGGWSWRHGYWRGRYHSGYGHYGYGRHW
jgi:outer membrane lipoprotein SlyB